MSAVDRLGSRGSLRRTAAAERAAAVPAAVGVLGAARSAAPVACALALRLAAAAEADCALVAGLGALAGPRAPARRSAARLAGALVTRGVPALATGRLVRADLADAGGVPALHRVSAAVPGPAVLFAGALRTEAVDAALLDLDAVVLVPEPGADPDVADLAAAALTALGHRTCVATGEPDLLTRALALAGLAALGPLRAAAADVLEAGR